jgi:hypothetical protein
VLTAETCEVISRKGYRLALAQIQPRLWPVWSRVLIGRTHFAFSDFDYCEMEIPVAPHPQVLTIRADPLQIVRPEGDWGQPRRPDTGGSETG